MSRAVQRIQAVALANLRASPVKSAMLGAATLVLMILLVRQFGAKPGIAAGDEVELAVAAQPDVAPGAEGQATRPRSERRPRPALARTLARNPFACSWLADTSWVQAEAASEIEEEEGDLVLQCTMQSAGGTPLLAVISGVIVYPGSKLSGYEVVKIGPRHAVLRSGTDERILKMR